MPKKDLYRLASAFSQTRLWERLCDSELFAVRMPEGETGYVCVMGMLGNHLALAVYPGSAGLDSYRLIGQNSAGSPVSVRREQMMSQNCVMCSFVDREELEEQELAEIRKHGLRFRGRRSHPLFQRFKPRRFPWYVEDPQDEERLRLGLLAGLEVARRLEGPPLHAADAGAFKAELGFSEGPPFDREIPLLTPREDGTFAWGRTRLPDPAQPVHASPRLTDELLVAKLKKLKRSAVWECGVFMYPEPVLEGKADAQGLSAEPERVPYFPYALMMVDHAYGMVLHMGVTKRLEADVVELVTDFAEGLMRNGRPEEILVQDLRSFELLANVAKQLDIRMTLAKELPFLEEAVDQLLNSAGADEDSEALLRELLEQAQGMEIPDEIRALLENAMDGNALPDALAERMDRVLEEKPSRSEKTARPKQSASKRKASFPGSYLLSVSLVTGCYRHIRIPASATLLDLHTAILNAFGLDDGQAHAFFLNNRFWSKSDSYVGRRSVLKGRYTSGYALGEMGLSVGKQFKYLFDFDAEWRFQCKVLGVLEEAGETRVVRSVGDSPPRYGAPEDRG